MFSMGDNFSAASFGSSTWVGSAAMMYFTMSRTKGSPFRSVIDPRLGSISSCFSQIFSARLRRSEASTVWIHSKRRVIEKTSPRIKKQTSRMRNWRSEEHTSELQSREKLVCRLLLEEEKKNTRLNS